MHEIRKILVPTDFSPSSSQTLSYALWFADHVDASLDLLHVVYPGTDVMDFPSMAAQVTKVQVDTAQQVMQVFIDEAMTRVQSIANMKNVPVIRSKVEVGTPGNIIATAAKDLASDLIIIGTRGEHNRLEIAFGSVTTSTLAKSTVPVLVVPAELTSMQIKTLGFATSLDESDPFRIWQAAQMLSRFKASLQIIHVRRSPDEETKVDLEVIKNFFEDKKFAPKISFHETTNADIEEGLEDFVSDYNIDLLIMHSPKRNLFERIGHHSVSRKMALYSRVPLLILK